MTKKERARNLADNFALYTEPTGQGIRQALSAIIDALPDEPPPHHWRFPDGTTQPYKDGDFAVLGGPTLVVGPEPKEVKTPEEPLWEGDIWKHGPSGNLADPKQIHVIDKEMADAGWRKIKVREVRP